MSVTVSEKKLNMWLALDIPLIQM